MKRIISFLLIVIMLAVMAIGCGQSEVPDNSGTSEKITEAATSETVKEEPPKEVKLNIAIMCSDFTEAVEEMMSEYTKNNPHVKFDFSPITNTNQEFLQPKAAAGNLPDFFSTDASDFFIKLADDGQLADLRNTKAWENMIDSLKPGFTSPKGVCFGISGGLATSLIFYNKEMFAKAGVNNIPKDWDEFLEVCEAIKKADITPLILTPDVTFGNTVFSWGFAQNVVAKDSDWKNKILDGSFNFNSPEIVDIYTKTKQLVDKGYVQKGVISTDYMSGNNMFVQEKAAMHFAGVWLAGMLTQTEFETGVFLPPWNLKGQELMPVVANETGFGVSEKSGNKEEAIKFLEFWTSDGYHIYQNARMNVPHMKNTEGLNIKMPQQLTEAMPKIQSAKVSGQMWFEFLPASLIQVVPKTCQQVIGGEETPEGVANIINEEFKKSRQ